MTENQKYIILGGAAFVWMLLMLFVVCIAGSLTGSSESQAQMPSQTFVIFKQKPAMMTDINTMMPGCGLSPYKQKTRLIPTTYYYSSNRPSYADGWIKTENRSLYTSSSRLGEGDGEYSGFYRGMLWYNSVFNQYEHRDWLGR